MSRYDNEGMFWQDKAPERTRGVKAPTVPDTSHLAVMAEGGLGFEPRENVLTRKEVAPYVPAHHQAILDIECYRNYFLIKFMRLSDDGMISFERTEDQALDCTGIHQVLRKYEVITFNGNHYDILMLRLALSGATNLELKEANDAIVKQDMTPHQFEQKFKPPYAAINHIDLIEVAPGMVSLKLYAGRLNSKELQDLPFDPEMDLTREQMDVVDRYCGKDLKSTKVLLLDLLPQIELRRNMSATYKIDLRSKSDPQIAEEVLKRAMGHRLPRPVVEEKDFLYQRPEFVWSNNAKIRAAIITVTENPFHVTKTGRIEMPKALQTLQIPISKAVYQMGMGGLHSTESGVHHIADEEFEIYDWDVASYYPSIILNCKLYPERLGERFLEVYRAIVEERLEAKHSGDKVKADSLKITINGSFGKLGSPYSVLYAPELMVQVTVTGQLSLLMLIDTMEYAGFEVLSANTDGIVIKCPKGKKEKMGELVSAWEAKTGFMMESNQYRAIFSRDVNNYVAIKMNGEVKTKGTFSCSLDKGFHPIAKNPQNEICNVALIEFLRSGKPFIDTITECTDITRFLTVRTVNGGAIKDKKFLGKVVRWYYAKGVKGNIEYKSNGNMVPRTVGAQPLMDLPDEFPADADYQWYEQECVEMLKGLGLRLT